MSAGVYAPALDALSVKDAKNAQEELDSMRVPVESRKRAANASTGASLVRSYTLSTPQPRSRFLDVFAGERVDGHACQRAGGSGTKAAGNGSGW